MKSIKSSNLEGLVLIESQRISDDRGSFKRLYCQYDLNVVLNKRSISQINHSVTNKVGTIRGLHFQHPPFAEMKIIQCIKGKVWDIAVDLRKNSPTFLKWHSQILSEQDDYIFIIPEGFAHGFQVLKGNSELLYMHTAPYQKDHEGGLRYNDPRLKINWPIARKELSERDSHHALIDDLFKGVSI